jgi:surfactin synthase thioesterase subunit
MTPECTEHSTREVTPDAVTLIQIRQPAVPSTYRMICFPSRRNSSVCYLAMSELLLPTVELLIIQYPAGTTEEEQEGGDRTPLVDKIIESIRGWADRPLALFGHRLGAELAYAVARRLEQEEHAVPLTLFVSGCTGPANRGTIGPPSLTCRVVALAGHHDDRAPLAGMRAWRRCTAGRFDLEVFPAPRGYLDSHRREVVNLVHDQLISLPASEPD